MPPPSAQPLAPNGVDLFGAAMGSPTPGLAPVAPSADLFDLMGPSQTQTLSASQSAVFQTCASVGGSSRGGGGGGGFATFLLNKKKKKDRQSRGGGGMGKQRGTEREEWGKWGGSWEEKRKERKKR